jgi:hypothetical protein
MEVELEKKINETISQLNKLSSEEIDYNNMDPIAKMMLVALLGESQKIQDQLDAIGQKVTDRYCTDFIPRKNIEAIPAIALISPTVKQKKDIGFVSIDSGASFTYKDNISHLQLNYLPIFHTEALLYSKVFTLTHHMMKDGDNNRPINMDNKNIVWVGIVTDTEVESVKGLSLLIKGTSGINPEHIYVGQESKEMIFSTMQSMENIEMAEPFDAQQSSGQFFSYINEWRERLINMDNASLICITDETQDRDLFKPRSFPKGFLQWLEDDVLDLFVQNTLWIQLEFPKGYEVPDTFEAELNVFPVVNVDINQVTLTQTVPVAKLQKQNDSFFMSIVETSNTSHNQGFNMMKEDIIVRDYDAACYNNGDLYRDVRNLYNRFLDDYYAFVEYNSIKDGELLKQLREAINKLGKSVGGNNSKYKFDSGTYAMRNMNQYPPSQSVKVSYMTTQGEKGNIPKLGESMENKKIPMIDTKLKIVVAPMGGTDKASADKRYELLRYYSLTNDRLYTKMDIDAFLRKEIIAKFGKEEFKRIFIKINIEGVGGEHSLQRGLYIDIEFKDKKNYEKAVNESFDKQMKQKIDSKSCISMPIMIGLINLEI